MEGPLRRESLTVVLRGAAEPDHAHEHAALHPAYQRLFEEGRESPTLLDEIQLHDEGKQTVYFIAWVKIPPGRWSFDVLGCAFDESGAPVPDSAFQGSAAKDADPDGILRVTLGPFRLRVPGEVSAGFSVTGNQVGEGRLVVRR